MLGGVGIAEVLLIILMAVVLFGAPAIIAFWIGYQAGQRKASTPTESMQSTEIADEESQNG